MIQTRARMPLFDRRVTTLSRHHLPSAPMHYSLPCFILSLPVSYLSPSTCLSTSPPLSLYLPSLSTCLLLPVSLPVSFYLSLSTCLSLPVSFYLSPSTCLSLPVSLYLSLSTCLSLSSLSPCLSPLSLSLPPLSLTLSPLPLLYPACITVALSRYVGPMDAADGIIQSISRLSNPQGF